MTTPRRFHDSLESHIYLGEGRKKPSMYMVTPYMEHDLSGLLENPAVSFTQPQIKCYMLQLLEGLKYLHGVLLCLSSYLCGVVPNLDIESYLAS